MKKYWVIFGINVQKALIYRFRISTWAVFGAIAPMIMISVWTKYYQEGGAINGFSYTQLLTYYLIVILLGLWTSKVNEIVEDDIKNGELANFVTKPLNYFLFRFFWEAGRYVVKFILFALPFLVCLFVFTNFEINNLIYLLLILPTTYLLTFFMSMVIGLLTFYATSTVGIANLYAMLMELITGKFFPITFFPLWTQNLLNYLPFKYAVYYPAQVIGGLMTQAETLNGLLAQTTWILLLYLLCQLLWNRGIKKFSAVGL